MSRVIAVSGGCTTRLMSESSQPISERSSGTENPICCATPRPVTARRSLSKMIAVGGFGDESSRRVARRPALGRVVGGDDLRLEAELANGLLEGRVRSSVWTNSETPATRAILRWPRAARYWTASITTDASSCQTAGRGVALERPSDHDGGQPDRAAAPRPGGRSGRCRRRTRRRRDARRTTGDSSRSPPRRSRRAGS